MQVVSESSGETNSNAVVSGDQKNKLFSFSSKRYDKVHEITQKSKFFSVFELKLNILFFKIQVVSSEPTIENKSSTDAAPESPHGVIVCDKSDQVRLSVVEGENLGFGAPLDIFECEIECEEFHARRPSAVFHNLRVPILGQNPVIILRIFRKDGQANATGLYSRQSSGLVYEIHLPVAGLSMLFQSPRWLALQPEASSSSNCPVDFVCSSKLLQRSLTEGVDLSKPRVLLKILLPDVELPNDHILLPKKGCSIDMSGGTNQNFLSQADAILHQKVLAQVQKYQFMQASRGILSHECLVDV